MPKPIHFCAASVFSGGSFRGHPCGKAGKVERDGKWFCGIHDPVKRDARRETDRKAREADWAQRERERVAKTKTRLSIAAILRLARDGKPIDPETAKVVLDRAILYGYAEEPRD